MIINKEVIVKGKKALLSYDNNMFGKDANTLESDGYTDATLKLLEDNVTITLLINGEEYYCPIKSDYKCDFYFEVVDRDEFSNDLFYSETIYDTIKNEADLIEVLIGNSRYIDEYEYINNEDESNLCPKGFVLGYCDDNTSNNCEYSALNRDGLCGAECLDCMGDILASAKEKAYVCSCSKISLENNF